MICIHCGSENLPGADLCQACGSDLAGLDLPEAQRGFAGRLLTGRVDGMVIAEPVRVAPDDTVGAAIAAMREAREGCALIVEDGRLTGIFTERDVLVRMLRPGRDPRAVTVREVMTPGPRTVELRDPPAFAIHRMVSQSCRHLPVTEGEELRGFVSARSVLGLLAAGARGER